VVTQFLALSEIDVSVLKIITMLFHKTNSFKKTFEVAIDWPPLGYFLQLFFKIAFFPNYVSVTYSMQTFLGKNYKKSFTFHYTKKILLTV
jgi:hypothetical protein